MDAIIATLASKNLKRIPLLKEIERKAAQHYLQSPAIQALPEGPERTQATNAALKSNFEGVPDFSERFYALLAAAAAHQRFTRGLIKRALETLDHGFAPFDAALLAHSCDIANAYDGYYRAWSLAVQGNEVARKLVSEPPTDPEILNQQYTIIQLDSTGAYYDVPYATYFKEELAPVLKAFDAAVEAIEAVPNKDAQQARHVDYLRHYRACLAEESREKLEPQWEELDRIWMDLRYPLQLVHDIESGYGDPLRIKVIPDFSLRFVDEDYKEANDKIEQIQGVMVDWFSKRTGDLARKGLNALASSFAAIYYIPFQSGMSLHFRFSGQSIPNRSSVKDVKGVKIYFDPISTKNRQDQTAKLIRKVFPEAEASRLISLLDPIETLTYHVAAHEVGHAIYNLETVSKVLKKTSTKSLLEEPRAELTSLHTLKLLLESNVISSQELEKSLTTFFLQDLRRFAMFEANATRPYTISAINTYKAYFREKYLTKVGEELVQDNSKALQVINVFSQQFETILDAEDRLDGDAIENVLKDMEEESEEIKWLVGKMK